MKTIHIKYFSTRACLTLDIHRLFEVIFETFGEVKILIEPMSENEKSEASENIDGIEAIKSRFIIFKREDDVLVRCREGEEKAVAEGYK